jgi:hypothetical protein
MTETRQSSGFALKGGAQHFIIGKKSAFQSDRAAQPLVDRQINFSHPAFADQMND